jgi:CHAD domain-containing protein
MATATPFQLAHIQGQTFSASLPRLLDGEIDAVHDARIAVRRVRELLPVMYGRRRQEQLGQLTRQFRKIGRTLGRVRDADIRLSLLGYLHARISEAVPLGAAQRDAERARAKRMRKLVKRFERMDVAPFLDAFLQHTSRRVTLDGVGWRWRLKSTLGLRATLAAAAIEQAAAVYFPNRLHRARVATKRLRYLLEAGEATGEVQVDGGMKPLRRTQSLLGDIHDRQILLDTLPAGLGDGASATHVDVVRQLIEAECRDLHARYLERRERLIEVCGCIQEQALEARRSTGLKMLALGAAALTIAAQRSFKDERPVWRVAVPPASREAPGLPPLTIEEIDRDRARSGRDDYPHGTAEHDDDAEA